MTDMVFRRILVPVDFSSPSERAWKIAQDLAATLGSQIVLVHVYVEPPRYLEGPSPDVQVREVYASGRRWVEEQLGRWADAARARGIAVKTLLQEGAAHEAIVATARAEGADLIAMGTHGYGGLDRLLLGSVADRVIRLAPCPVLAIRGSDVV
jgi:nucleotide-binding universal stress UspA family protein